MDTITANERSRVMARVRSRNTSPELLVRRLLHGLGYRYRIHVPALAGRPDIVFSARRKVIFIHGCFWHQHAACPRARVPKSNVDFWVDKFRANRERDDRALAMLRHAGWEVRVVWECELGDAAALSRTLRQFLGPTTFRDSKPS